MSCKLIDSLLIGDTFTGYQGFFIFLDFIGFNYRFGQMIGINEQLVQVNPLKKMFSIIIKEANHECVEDNFHQIGKIESSFGYHTLILLILPFISTIVIL